MIHLDIAALKKLLAVFEADPEVLKLLLAARLFPLLLIELDLALFETGLVCLRLLHALSGRTFGVTDYLHFFLLGLEEFRLLDHFSLAASLLDDSVGPGGSVFLAGHIRHGISDREHSQGNYDPYCSSHVYCVLLIYECY